MLRWVPTFEKDVKLGKFLPRLSTAAYLNLFEACQIKPEKGVLTSCKTSG
jgi:hypothetical protein